ncbi:cytochrome D1 domain-containing protein [Paractinoplanes maris]|uniref:cytochrome D1 domain-containing protein n=1 Tax=Paractinoplanes maris TaxID=1734446 RepID=UPI002020D1BA|nr:cytochrome D1 domain-containing protein [Actinoplanes maris]
MPIEIFSTDTDSGQISVVRKDADGYTNVTAIPVGNAPRGSVKFTRDGRGFVSNTSTNSVSEIDALTHREVARISVGSGPRGIGILPGDRYMLVSNSGSNTVSIVDLESREELTQVAVGRDPRHMAIVGDFAYVCIWGSGYLAKIDIAGLHNGDVTNVREIARIRIQENSHPYSLNVDRTGRYALVACNSVGYVPVIDLTTDKVVHRVAVTSQGGRAVAFSPDNRFALVTLERESTVAVIDMSTFEATRYLPVGPSPRGIAVDENDFTIYAAAFARGTVMHAGQPGSAPHAITVVKMDGVDLSTDEETGGRPVFDDIQVGFGPCSVSLFDTDRVSLDNVDIDAKHVADSSVGSAG